MWKEFREFIARGSVFDLAVGIVIGAAFTTVVNSFVNDLIMPIIGFILGGSGFTNYFIVLRPMGATFVTLAAAKEAGAVTLNWGMFINGVINFLIVAAGALLPDQGRQQALQKAGSASARRKGVPLLLLEGAEEGHTLPTVHVRVEGVATAR